MPERERERERECMCMIRRVVGHELPSNQIKYL
jgi:hypothetical protein